MSEAAALEDDTLFLACTRPAMIAGVTMEAMGINVIASALLFLVCGSLLYGLVAIPIHLIPAFAETDSFCGGFPRDAGCDSVRGSGN